MASIARDPGGYRRILFIGAGGVRRTIRLGKMPQRSAEAVKIKVESLVAAQIAGHAVDDEIARWLASLDETMTKKLIRCGLARPRKVVSVPTLAEWIDGYIAGRASMKPNTVRNCQTARKRLTDYFGESRTLDAITPADAEAFRESMFASGLSPATIGREIKRARQFFRSAVRRRLIAENPFQDVQAPAQENSSRAYFVTREHTQRLLDAAPDAQWRLLIALARFGGLRTPSESMTLQWSDVDWDHERITIRAPKLEHHPGGGIRVIPLFPELRPHLDAVWELAEPGATHVVRRRAPSNDGVVDWKAVNLRTRLLAIIRRAGLKCWPRPWQNLRASRETELAESFPLHVCCQWIGNSRPVAMKHYLQTTDQHFEKALRPAAVEPESTSDKAAQIPAHKTAQQPSARHCGDSQGALAEPKKTLGFAGVFDPLQRIARLSQYPRQDSNLQPTD